MSLKEELNKLEDELQKEIEGLNQEFLKFEDEQTKAREEKAFGLQKREAELRENQGKRFNEIIEKFDKELAAEREKSNNGKALGKEK